MAFLLHRKSGDSHGSRDANLKSNAEMQIIIAPSKSRAQKFAPGMLIAEWGDSSLARAEIQNLDQLAAGFNFLRGTGPLGH